MSASILSLVLLVSPASLPSLPAPPGLFEPESGAWAVVHAGSLWVCWTPAPDCFERIEFDDDDDGRAHELADELEGVELDHAQLGAPTIAGEAWRLGFWGPRSLWIELGERRYRVLAGQRRARVVDEPAPVRLLRPRPPACAPRGLIPASVGGRLSWREAPPCAAEATTRTCVSAAGPRLRSPTPVRLRAGFEIVGARSWAAGDDAALGLAIADRRRTNAVEVSFVVELGFDWQRRVGDRRARTLLAQRGRPRLRELPPVPAGPRAAAELHALAEVVCAGGPR